MVSLRFRDGNISPATRNRPSERPSNYTRQHNTYPTLTPNCFWNAFSVYWGDELGWGVGQ